MDLGTLQTVALIAIGVLVVIAVLIGFLVRTVVTKVIGIALLLGLALVIYLQRDNLSDCAKDCSCSFFGYQVDLGDQITAACRDIVN